LVVRQAPPRIEQILICTGGTEIAEPAIETGARLAGLFGAKVSLLHVADAIPSMYTGLEEIEETLPTLLSTNTPFAQHLRHSAEILTKHNIPSQLKLRHGVVTEEILREVDMGNYDLIVSGSPEKTRGLKRLFLGDVVEDVIKRTSCPFLIVKKPLAALPSNERL
jgi:nucleotide-binding universal stress UspA family protein